MWKFYFIEILDSFSLLFWTIALLAIIASVISVIWYIHDYDDDDEVTSKRVLKRSVFLALVFSITTCLIPSKEFMYINLGIHETVKFIEGNEETKEIGAKIIKIVNNKLDEMVDSSENK